MPTKAFEERLQQAAREQESATRFLNRVTWWIVGVLCALAVEVGIAPFARNAGYIRLLNVFVVAAAFELLAVVALVILLRRRLASQIARGTDYQKMLRERNDRLRERNEELEASQQQLAEHAEGARLLSRRLAEAQRVAQIGYWEIDSRTGEVFWSDEMYRIAGIEVGIQPPPTDRYLAAVHPDDRAQVEELVRSAVNDMAEFAQQYRLVHPDGSVHTIQAIGRILVDERGERRLVGTIQDISERTRLEAQLRRSQKMEAVGLLAGGVAHDFNNVLTVIEGYTSLLLSGRPANDPDRPALEEIRSSARRAAALTRQLLAFSRQQVLQPKVLDLNETIAGIEKMLRRLIGEHIEVHTRLEPQLDRVKADANQLEQVLINLVVNARDAMINGGVLTIETANVVLDSDYVARNSNVKPGPYVMLAVTDTGTGIAPADRERIFEPFFTTKASGKGTGLGLSTVLGIVEQSGGHITVYSEIGQGSSFKVYLPRVDAADDTVVIASSRTSKTGTETILLVEDDSAVRAVAAAVLRRAGYTIIETKDGVEALRVCQDSNVAFDLVLSDMVMPGLGGRALAGHVQRLRPNVPVVLMSGYTRDAMLHNAELGATSLFVEKPFTPESLTQKIRDALDRKVVVPRAVPERTPR